MIKYVNQIKYSRSAKKYIQSRNRKEQLKLRNIIEHNLASIPPTGDIKPLQGFSDERKRLRIGQLRIIFSYDTDDDKINLLILDIGSRGDIYK